MKVLFIICCLLSISLTGQCQYSKIHIGKIGNIIWNKKISYSHLDSRFTYYYPIFFKNSNHPKFTRAGIFGHRIKSQLNLEVPGVSENFSKYKFNKRLSYAFLGGTIASISMWTYSNVTYMFNHQDFRLQVLLKPKHLIYLGSYFACFYYSINLNLKGDKKLKNAVHFHNRSLQMN